MIYRTLRHTEYATATRAQAPTEVNLLHVRKETSVKATGRAIFSSAYHERCTSNPVYIAYRIILPLILFKGIEYASTTIGLTIAVDETTGCTRILKMGLALVVKNFGLTGHDIAVGVKSRKHGRYPPFCDFNIGVQQY